MPPLAAALFIFGIGSSYAKQADCLLEVSGRRYIDGVCEMESLHSPGSPPGSFQVNGTEDGEIEYFAQVNVDAPGSATGYWNGEAGASHAHDDLGPLTQNGACWINERARVCAWKIGENRSASPSSSDSASGLPQYPVFQVCTTRIKDEASQGFCIRQEQERYDMLQLVWEKVPAAHRARCAATAGKQPMWHYTFLLSCVNVALQRIENRPQPFRY